MEKVIWSCSDYSILRVGTDRLHDIARFVVAQNYNHHSSEPIPDTAQQEIEDIYREELSYSGDSACFIVRDKEYRMVGSIRVFRWDKRHPHLCIRFFIYPHWIWLGTPRQPPSGT